MLYGHIELHMLYIKEKGFSSPERSLKSPASLRESKFTRVPRSAGGFFIDHGMGVVIGETCEIGNNVTVFQGVTLGGTGKEKGKRHPTIEDDALISTGAKVLGSITVGRGAKIGAGSVVLHDVPECSTVVGIPGRVVVQNGKKIRRDLNHQDLPDPVADRFRELENEIRQLKQELRRKEREDEL